MQDDYPPNADMTKYCRYHRNHGHTTEDCKALPDKIEELVRVGIFCRFVRREDHSSRSHHPPRSDDRRPPRDSLHDKRPNQPTNQHPQPAHTNVTPADPPLRSTINTISDGFTSGGSTSSARKRHLRHIQSINHITHSLGKTFPPAATLTSKPSSVKEPKPRPFLMDVLGVGEEGNPWRMMRRR